MRLRACRFDYSTVRHWLFMALFLCACDETRTPSGINANPWVLRSDAELDAAIVDAREQARASERRVLLDFVADWCADCREVVRLSHRDPARSVIEERYVVLYVHVGRFDRHRRLLREHGIERIATLVVLDPESGRRIARTTLEPISDHSGLSSEELAAWLRDPS